MIPPRVPPRGAALLFLFSLALPVGARGAPPAGARPVVLPLSRVECADEEGERERGLMYRRELCPDCGMLFVFPEEGARGFWMRNTYLSLDMIFIESGGTIVTIHERTAPMSETPLYYSTAPARYVLEVNAGWASAHGLRDGLRVDLGSLLRSLVDYRPAGGP